MIRINDSEARLDDLLARMTESIQLDETRKARMESAYKSVEKELKNDELFFKENDFEIYPQGSVKIGTTVKPIVNNEFDLDIVVHIRTDWSKHKPSFIYNQLKRVLENNEVYKKMMESKNRCIRLNYSGDFHMDILPGCQENLLDNNKLKVPDRSQGDWVSSNPKGYADWFLTRTNMNKLTLLEKAYSVENLPIDEFSRKKPLQRSVQLIKMYRDKYFEKNPDKATSSIILTTISGQFYNGEDSIYRTIEDIITNIKSNISINEYNQKRLMVLNPVNKDEDFTDKWENEPELYDHFKKFIQHLVNEWKKLKHENSVENNSLILKGLFGESIYQKGYSLQEKYFSENPQKLNEYIGLRDLAKPYSSNQKPWAS